LKIVKDLELEKEVSQMLQARGKDLLKLMQKADEQREEQVGDVVTFIRNQNMNFSNVCESKCLFCGFSVTPHSTDIQRLSNEEIKELAESAKQRKVTEICITAGLDPESSLQRYLEVLSIVRKVDASIHIHAFSPMEIKFLAEKEEMEKEEVIKELIKGGIGSLCGTAAEILVDSVREVICPQKLNSQEWKETIELVHELGLRTTSTIMFGSIEKAKDIIAHFKILKEIQEKTKGFTEFIPLPFIHENTPLNRQGKVKYGPTGLSVLALYATARITLGELIPNIQSSWVKTGEELAQVALVSGVNDMGGTLYEENISKSAGASHGEVMLEEKFIHLIKDSGKKPVRRDTLYNVLEKY
jgi:FO synthase subunit 2